MAGLGTLLFAGNGGRYCFVHGHHRPFSLGHHPFGEGAVSSPVSPELAPLCPVLVHYHLYL